MYKSHFAFRVKKLFSSPNSFAVAITFGSLFQLSIVKAQTDFCKNYPPPKTSKQWQSQQVYYSPKGKLTYSSDKENNRIPDFSYSGYHYGEKVLPVVPFVKTLAPIKGDNTSNIQSAIDEVGKRTPDANGHRGALLLEPGMYEIWGTVLIRHSGVVLRGSGYGTDSVTNTILHGRGNAPHQREIIIVGSGKGNPWTPGKEVKITDQFVQVGSMSFNVEDASLFTIGQEVIITHPSSQAWIDSVKGGGVVNDPRWTAGSKDLKWIRKITKKKGKQLYIDAPIYNHLNRSLTESTLAPVTERSLVSEAGVENLRVIIETAGGEDENHAWSAIALIGAENCWVQNASVSYFGYAGVRTSGAIRITVQNVQATDPVAVRTGGRMYNFAVDAYSQLILFSKCHATKGRHSFISNGTTTVSGVVFYRCTMEGGDFEAHRHWSQGLILDNLRDISAANSQVKLINRGDMGSSHGWGAAHSVIWGCNNEIIVQKPPTAQNYVISTEGKVREKPFQPGPWGSIEVKSGTIVPESLYEAQLCERLKEK